MSALIAIDPGYAARGPGCAVAIFVGSRLSQAFFARPEKVRIAALKGVLEVVWECPQVDSRSRMSVPAIVQLAAVGGTLAGMYAGACSSRAVPVSPSEWKGATPKPVHHLRLWRALRVAEHDLLGGVDTELAIEAACRKGALDRWGKPGASYYPSTWWTHNLLDAVGIGLWRIGRAI